MRLYPLKSILGAALIAVLPFSYSKTVSASEMQDYKPVIGTIINAVIIPAYENLQSAASEQAAITEKLCVSASSQQLNNARQQYSQLVESWSHVEMYRFGPARKENRFERLFFWPDRRSRGIKQVQKILLKQDETAVQVDTLRKKSVAVQGILSLEYLLFGRGSDELSSGNTENFRCRYAHAVSLAIKNTSSDILEDWQAKDGYAHIMQTAGPNNTVFKNDQEVIRDILQRSSELIQSIAALKMLPSLQDIQEDARPKRVPLWRSNLFLNSLNANLKSLSNLQNTGKLYTLLPPDERGYAKGLDFEILQIQKTIRPFIDQNTLWKDILENKESYNKIRYILSPLKAINDILSEYYPETLGITMGFNSLDGD